MRRKARIIQIARVDLPDCDHKEAIKVTTDFAVPDERAFYLRDDSPEPVEGYEIVWGDQHAWYITAGGQQVQAEKTGYNFDPDAPLR